MSCVVPISLADPDCDSLPIVPHYAVIYVVGKSDPRHRPLIGRWY